MTKRCGLSRRRFLRRGLAAAGAAVAAPHVLSASALGKGGFAAPSDRITMGFIGVGGQGGGHLLGGAWTYLTGGYVARKDVQVLGVCDVLRDRREGRTQRVNQYYSQTLGQGKYESCKPYVDFRELLARPDVDAVLIGTPIHWHTMMTVMAAKAGKDVYCEKPTCLTIAEARALSDAVHRYGRVFQAGTQQRSEYGGKFRLACALARSGRIGKVHSVYSCINGGMLTWRPGFGPGQPVPDSLDWDLWLGPAPYVPYAGNLDAHYFGDGGINWGQHHFDIVSWAVDGDRTGPVWIGPEDGKVAMKFANGITVYACRYPGENIGSTGGVVIVGDEGRIAVDREHLKTYPASILEKPLGPGDEHLYENSGHSDNFLDCVRTRKRTICDAETACRAASLLILARIGELINRPLKWDPVKEQFLGDDEANRLLSVPTRPPWRL